MCASLSLKSSCGHCQLILANLVVGRGTGQLALDLLIIAAQVFERGTVSPMSWFFLQTNTFTFVAERCPGGPPLGHPGSARPPESRRPRGRSAWDLHPKSYL